MSDRINPSGGSAVPSTRISSGAKIRENPKKREEGTEKALDSVVTGVSKAAESVEQLSKASPPRIEVIQENIASSRTRLEDVEEAARLAKDLKLNIGRKKEEAASAHDINTQKAKELLR